MRRICWGNGWLCTFILAQAVHRPSATDMELTCGERGRKGLGELCIAGQPTCEYCGNMGGTWDDPRPTIILDWIPCRDNITKATPKGVGPCGFAEVPAIATFGGVTLANTTRARIVENNYYFPREDIDMSLFEVHDNKTYKCSWKGQSQYYNLVGSVPLADAMWSYEPQGVGKCQLAGIPVSCPSAYTMALALNYGSFKVPVGMPPYNGTGPFVTITSPCNGTHPCHGYRHVIV